MPPGSQPQGRAPERQEAGHTAQDDERLAVIVLRSVGPQIEVSAGRKQGGPNY